MYQRLVIRLVELGLITTDRAEAALTELADWGAPDRAPRDVDLLGALRVCGVAVPVHGDDVDFAEAGYRWVLEEAAALSGGAVTVTDVELVPAEDEDEERELRFRVNGVPAHWRIELASDDYLDLGAVWEGIEDLEPGGDDRRVFHPARPDNLYDDVYILATPEQALALRDEFGMGIRVRGLADPGD
ncbi:hypothetical protein [Embleya sp. AB8]|uniref:hypothetical protein n=1 Tax=Embleya sp. AB8 TaxID=3156304 RepID=UPI003C72F01C